MRPEFIEWWKNHRHSGYCYKHDPRLGHEVYAWNETPDVAFTILRYRVEFEDQTGISTGLSSDKFNQFSDEERASWRKDQEEADQFSEEYGFTFDAVQNQKIWDNNFHDAIEIVRETIRSLSARKSVRKEFEREDAGLTQQQKIAQLLAVENKVSSGVQGWEKAKQSYNELSEKRRGEQEAA